MFPVRVAQISKCYIKSRPFSTKPGSLVLFYKISRPGTKKNFKEPEIELFQASELEISPATNLEQNRIVCEKYLQELTKNLQERGWRYVKIM